MNYEVDSCSNSPSIEGTMFNTCDHVNSLAVVKFRKGKGKGIIN